MEELLPEQHRGGAMQTPSLVMKVRSCEGNRVDIARDVVLPNARNDAVDRVGETT